MLLLNRTQIHAVLARPSSNLFVTGVQHSGAFRVRSYAVFRNHPGFRGVWQLSRMETNADLRLGGHVRKFTLLQSAFAPGKQVLFAGTHSGFIKNTANKATKRANKITLKPLYVAYINNKRGDRIKTICITNVLRMVNSASS